MILTKSKCQGTIKEQYFILGQKICTTIKKGMVWKHHKTVCQLQTKKGFPQIGISREPL